MGRTRRRVTILVLTLESMGLVMLLAALYLAGERTLDCVPGGASTGATQAAQTCRFEERRVLWLVPVRRATYEAVDGARLEERRGNAWLVLASGSASQPVLSAGTQRITGDVARIEAALAKDESVRLEWEDGLAAAAVAAFGLLWLAVMVLIMREFLGYHTPWWWRIVRRR